MNQATIRSTICVGGWTRTIRPSRSYTGSLKRRQMAEYGYSDGAYRHEEDHLIPLELGGAPRDPLNLWPQPGFSPNPKDGLESYLRSEVCDGTLVLIGARKMIATDWVAAHQMDSACADWKRRCGC